MGKIKSEETKLKMSQIRKEWYKNNPIKAKAKAEKMQITKILNGTHAGKNNSNYGTKKFMGKSYRGQSWNKGLTKNNNPTLLEISKNEMGENNPYWKGDNVGYYPLHQWIKKYKPKPQFCVICGINPPYDLANISGKYKRDVNDFKWVCRRCHMEEDGRIINLKHQKGGLIK